MSVEVLRNYQLNPKLSVDGNGWGVQPGTGGSTNTARMPNGGPVNNCPFFEMTWTVAASGGTIGADCGPLMAWGPNEPVTGAVYAQCDNAGPTWRVRVVCYDAAFGVLSTIDSNYVSLGVNTWQWLTASGITPANTAWIRILTRTAALGTYRHRVSCAMAIKSVSPTPYFDGDSAKDVLSTHVAAKHFTKWSGAAGVSTSQLRIISDRTGTVLARNEVINSGLAVNGSGWNMKVGTGGNGTLTYMPNGGPDNGPYLRYTVTTQATASDVGIGLATPNAVPVVLNELLSFYGYVRCSRAVAGAKAQIDVLDAANTYLGQFNQQFTLLAATWTLISRVATVVNLAGAAKVNTHFRLNDGTLLQVGDTWDIALPHLAKISDAGLWDYFDGAKSYQSLSVPEASRSYEGVANASPSLLTLPSVDQTTETLDWLEYLGYTSGSLLDRQYAFLKAYPGSPGGSSADMQKALGRRVRDVLVKSEW